jgi:hypothetical protein
MSGTAYREKYAYDETECRSDDFDMAWVLIFARRISK